MSFGVERMIKDTAIVFVIFDGYEDLWDDAINLLKRFWPKHPPIYVFTNTKSHNWSDVTCIPVGKDAEWSKKVQKALEVIKEQYLILMLEDFYVGSIINDEEVMKLIDYMSTKHIKYCRLCNKNRIIPQHLPRFESGFPYEVIYQDQKYGISLQASIWERSYLSQAVGHGNYNAWVFEVNQVKKTLSAEHIPFAECISDPRNILHIQHGALQGKMLPDTVAYFKRIGCPLTTNREIMNRRQYIRFILKHLGKDLTPAFAKRWIKNIARKMGYSFLDEKWS